MEKFPLSSPEKPALSEDEKKRLEFYRVSKAGIAETYKTSKERVEYIKSTLEGIMPLIENKEAFLSRLDECADIEEKDQFVDALFELFKPIIDKKFEDPESFLAEGEKRPDYIEINKVVSYEISESTIFIHIYLNEVPEQRNENILTKFKEAMQKLAQVVQNHPEISLIEGNSLMIARRPRVIERFGFTVDKESTESSLNRRAYISREDFLKRYLKG